MAAWKMPPPIKVYEALGAIGDGRVRPAGGGCAAHAWGVVSSDGGKTYRVEISADGREISSNDNASYWQGYLGYPAIAVLITRGTLSATAGATRALAGIPWKELNHRFKNDYARTTAEVARIVGERGGDFEAIRGEAAAILAALAALGLERGARRRPPREGGVRV
ncbi:MAG TPA: hypothetical protein VMI09_11985 [Candidatus Binataceae bacterium]|nr:hypothetical protein [Candidatus Binataceae bacterium]